MLRTSKYQLGYFQKGDVTSADVEMQRFETLDAQLHGLFSIIGNGVLSGWDILPSSGLSVTITPGTGHVAFVAAESTATFTLDNLTPGSDLAPTTNYIYAQLVDDSYWTKNVVFAAYVSENALDQSLLIGTVSVGENSVLSVDTSVRQELGFIGLIKEVVSNHKHIGGADNPPPIDLASEVQGVLNQNNLPDLDASIIQAGTLDIDRLPQISHVDNLIDQGTLSHPQLESILESLSISGQNSMGEVALTNLLQLVLALKHVYPNIDDYLVNCISIIPGISPDDYIDTTNTTATVDTRTYLDGGTHTISGTVSAGRQLYTKIWDDLTDYDGSTKSDVVIDGNSIVLDTTTNQVVVDNFAQISGWQITTQDSSSVSASVQGDTSSFVSGPQSAKISINGNEIEMVLLSQKEFSPQDWSAHKYIKFYILTDSIQHGDVFFYFRDGTSGIQNSYIKVLDRNKPTINQDTLQNGWQEVSIDISGYDRSSVNLIAFMLSTQDGWNTSKDFSFNVDDIILSTGNLFKDNGYIRFTYGNDFPYNFSALRWDAYLPTGTILKAKARFANSIVDLSTAIWTEYITVSGSSFGLEDSEFFKYIEIELFLESSTDNDTSPYVNQIYLDYFASDTTNNTSIDTKEGWDSGKSFNIDTASSPGSIKVGGMEDIGTINYGEDGNIGTLNSDFSIKSNLSGTAIPRSTNQCLLGTQSGFGLITAIDRGNNGNVWVADTDNDRIIEVDKSGNMVRAFYGSFLAQPKDVYGVEDSGTGSNIYSSNVYQTEFDTATTTTTPSVTPAIKYELDILHSIYNPDLGKLYVVFNKNLEDIYAPDAFDRNKLFLKVGSHVFQMGDANIQLLGVNEEKYDLWAALYKSKTEREKATGKHIRQFKFSSHVLEITMPQSEQIALNKMVRSLLPRVSIANPFANETTGASYTASFVYYNADIGPDGDYAKVYIDGGSPTTIYTTTFSMSALASGEHTIKIELYDADDNLYANVGAVAESAFIVEESSEYLYPVVRIASPHPNQMYSSDVVSVSVETKNFPVIPSGQHIHYQVDGGTIQDYFSSSPITISDLSPGEHTLTVVLVDENSNTLSYDYGSASVDFIVGMNPEATTYLYYAKDLVKDISGTFSINSGKKSVDVANITFANIYSPIDLQVVAYETFENATTMPSILVGKLRSPSWTTYLGDSDASAEFAKRILNAVPGNTNQAALNPLFTSIETSDLVFGGKFMDGHSVIQIDLSGNVLLSNNAAVFAASMEEAKNILGGVKKVGQNELLIADSKNQRAIITYTDMGTQDSKITWQYDSDRYVVDFVKFPEEDMVISVGNGAIDQPDEVVVRGYTITWKNDSAAPIEIYSGNTDYESFYDNPNLSQYGVLFQSGTLNPGETYSYRFETNGEFDWFVYPSILTGKVTVTEQRISSNDMFYILESDGLDSPYTSRAIKVDSWGNVLWSFGNNYLVKPRDIRTLSGGRVLIST